MRKEYVIRIELLNASDKERRLIEKHMKQHGFKKVSKDGVTWHPSEAVKNYTDITDLYNHIKSLIERINYPNVCVTTAFERVD